MECRGFTLLELVVALAVLGIVLSIGMPAFGSLIDNQRMDSSVSSLLRSINYTRSEAVRRNRPVTMAPIAEDWNSGWIIFLDTDGNGRLDAGETVLLEELPAKLHELNANNNIASYLRYNAQGESELLNGGFQSGTFFVCPHKAVSEGRKVIINRLGRARVERAPIDAQHCQS